jgi:hypothetical protein
MSICTKSLLSPKNELQLDETIRNVVYCIQECIVSYIKVNSEW